MREPEFPDLPREDEAILEKAKGPSRFGDWFPGRVAERNRMFEDLREDAKVDSRGFLVTFLEQVILWVALPVIVAAALVLFFLLAKPAG
jgi:hypothetical protein